ncbi:MAG TPA: hypothetical protein VJV23_12350 [Candidatus Polarisedimenticolia bacterium]|nr:hypothetical protein [Candidatus Polarisedimenticolia bacterium]
MTRRALAGLGSFAVAMAYLEAAVVVYLRQIYYPQGFDFPITIIVDWMAAVEIGREAATVVMLWAVARLSGTDRWERFLHFCFLFGVWDIFYYIWLYVILGWPPSLLTWDILFLIPVPWIGPVLAPVLVSVGLIAGSWILLAARARGAALGFSRLAWGLALAGGALVLLSFVADHRVALEQRLPGPFRWGLFGSGLALGIAALALGRRELSGGIPRPPR